MSTGFECYFAQVTPGEWFYVLQNWDCPVGAWDWQEYATAYGPFSTEEEAQKHLSDNHANPGGYSTYEGPPEGGWSETAQGLFDAARKRNAPIGRFR